MTFKDILNHIRGKHNIVSPLPKGNVAKKNLNSLIKSGIQTTPTPTATPTPKPRKSRKKSKYGRNPNWDKWKRQSPKTFQELFSGAEQASKKHGVPTEMLMDISGLETSGGQLLNQISGGPGQGYYQFEPSTVRGLGIDNFNPYSATQSADLAGQLIKQGQLSRWGTPNSPWGVLDNPNRTEKLTDWYMPDELNSFLSSKYRL